MVRPQASKASCVGGAYVRSLNDMNANDSSPQLDTQTDFDFIYTHDVNKSDSQMKFYRFSGNHSGWLNNTIHFPSSTGKCALNLFLFVAASHQTRLDTWSKARRPIKVGVKGRERSGTNRDPNPAGLCYSSVHLVQCEPEASNFTNPNVGPGTYAGLWLELDSKV